MRLMSFVLFPCLSYSGAVNEIEPAVGYKKDCERGLNWIY